MKLGDLALGVLVGQRAVTNKRHRMNLDVIADDEFHAGKADAVGRDAPPAESGGRVGEIKHHPRARFWNVGEIKLLGFVIGKTLIDETEETPSAHDTVTSCSLCNTSVALPVPTIAGRPSFAADDGGVRRAPTP